MSDKLLSSPENTPSFEILQKISTIQSEIHQLFEHVSFGSHIADVDDVYQQINSLELAWLGCTKAEIIGKKTLSDFLTPDSRQILRQHFSRLV